MLKVKILLLAIVAVVLLYQVDKPFWGHHDFNNAFYGNMARNLLRYPLWETKLGQVINSGYVEPANFAFHTHHPPLLIWSLAVSYLIFGVSEVSTKVVPIIFSILTLLFFFSLLNKIFDRKVAVIASFFWLVTPIFMYFGKMAVHEVLVSFFFVFSFWTYFYSPKLLLPVLFLGCLSGWPGYYVPFIIFAFDRKKTTVLLVPFIAFTLHLMHNWVLTGSVLGGGFDQAFSLRSGGIALLPYMKKEISWIFAYFTKPLVILAILGFVTTTKKRLITAFLVFGLAHLVIFRQAAERHDYLIYYLLPFITLAAALAIKRFWYLAPIVMVLMIMQSYDFTKALLESDYDREAVILGKQIHLATKPFEPTEIFNSKIHNNSEAQLIFYADRQVTVKPN